MLALTGCIVDLATGRIGGDDQRTLTERERVLLCYLASRPSQVVSRDELLTEVWGYSDQVVSRAVDNAMRRLREKVELDPAHPNHLITAFGAGYRFEPLRAPDAPVVAAAQAPAQPRRCVTLGELTVDLDLGSVAGGDKDLALTTSELALLVCLIERAGRIVDRRDLARALGQHGDARSRALDNTLYRLRAKLEPDPDAPRFLLTVRGSGYRLVTTPAEPAGPPGEAPTLANGRDHTLVHVGLAEPVAAWAGEAAAEGGDAIAAQIGALVAWLDDAAATAGGVRVNDAWGYVFDDPAAGVRFAAQAATAPSPLSPAHPAALRAGVHRGRPIVWVDPVTGRTSCLGPAVYRAEDLLRHAAPAAVLVDDSLWAELVRVDAGAAGGRPVVPRAHLGAVELGGAAASDDDAPPDAAAQPVAADARLPWIGDRFVGRADELAEVVRLIRDGARLVALVGPPGVGKSRLALEALTAAVPTAGAAVYVALAGVHTAQAAIERVAGALRVPLGADPEQQLALALAGRGRTVIWLDDCDESCAAVVGLASRWLDAAPELALVATARRALGLRGEQVIEVEPLTDDDAFALFVDRMDADHRPEDAAVVRDLVRQLDGLPLALELAAARTASIGLHQLAARLPNQHRLLARSDVGVPERQRSVRAALDVSWDLLDRFERGALARCALFRGGFTLEAAEEVLEPVGAEPGAPWVLDLVEALVRHHLVRVGGGRYTLLDSVRTYAESRLAPDEAAAARALHARMYARLGAPAALDALGGTDGAERFAELLAEQRNLEAAAEWARAAADDETEVAIALAVAQVRTRRGPFGPGAQALVGLEHRAGARAAEVLVTRGWMWALAGDREAALGTLTAAAARAAADGDPSIESWALTRAGDARGSGRNAEALAAYDRAVALARAAGDTRAECAAMLGRATDAGDVLERVEGLEATVRLARASGAVHLEGLAVGTLAIAERGRGRIERARELCEAALVIHRELGDRRAEALALGNLANTLRWTEPQTAMAYYRAALMVHRQIGSPRGEVLALANIGMIHADAHNYEAARSNYAAATDAAIRLGHPQIEALCRSNLGEVLRRLGREREAGEHLERALTLAEETGAHELIAAAALGLTSLPRLRGAKGLGLLERAAQQLAGREPLLAVRLSARIASALVESGDRGRAVEALFDAESRLDELPVGLGSAESVWAELEDARTQVRGKAAPARAHFSRPP